MRSVLVGTLVAVASIGTANADLPAAQREDPELLWLSNPNIKTLQRDLQAAADRGYRLVPLPTGQFGDFFIRAVLLEKTTAQPEPVEYLLLRSGDVNEAAARGYRFAGAFTGVLVMQRRKGNTTRTHEYVALGTRLKHTMEDELLTTVAKGFRVVGLQTLGLDFPVLHTGQRELAAILERPVQAAEAVHPQYVILYSLKASTTQAELQAAADRGYRLSPLQGAWGSTVLLEKADDIEPIEYVVISAAKTETMQEEIDKASAEGYRFACTLGSGLREFVIAMQRLKGSKARTHEHVLLAASRYKTMERELLTQLAKGFRVVGLTSLDSVTGTFFGRGPEGIAVLERRVD